MAAWLTVYCTRSVRHVTAKDVLTGIDYTDFYTTAEGYGIDDEEMVDAALANLRFESVEGGTEKLRIRYRPGETRPVRLHLWHDPATVAEEREEALDSLDGAGPKRVRQCLQRTVEVAALELGWSQLEDMGIVFAGQTAELLARLGDGLICDQNGNWWRMKKYGATLLHQAY